MPRYHVLCIPDNGKPALYMARRPNEFHDGPYTDNFQSRLTTATATGFARRIEAERDRQPNQYYGRMTFEVVQEMDFTECVHCGRTIHQEGPDWLDVDQNDCCPHGFVAVRHEPKALKPY